MNKRTLTQFKNFLVVNENELCNYTDNKNYPLKELEIQRNIKAIRFLKNMLNKGLEENSLKW